MVIDHSHTYKSKSLKDLPHRLRLKAILLALDVRNISPSTSYADFGCSNGYITNIIATHYSIADVHGFDVEEDHLAAARETYPEIVFVTVNLNSPEASGAFDLVTCFETLEHVGNLQNALLHLISATKKGGTIFISVPIEIGPRGLIKFLAKTMIYRGRYQRELEEVSNARGGIGVKYFSALLLNKDIAVFRDERSRWGTHFGFDYRRIDKFLRNQRIHFTAYNRFTTRFYLIEK